jgi:hypothetical protein
MQSTNPENHFSMEDFEKGLMVAGYILPTSIFEINEREALEQYEKELGKAAQKLHFKRVVLAAEIVSKLFMEPTFGRVKFQKLVNLCEHAASMNLAHRYQKQMAGPFDNKFMHSINREFQKNRWFLEEKQIKNNITRSVYTPMENADDYKTYYTNYFKDANEQIQFIIELFRKKDTATTELAATVFACVQEILGNKSMVKKQDLFNLFYSWSEKKARFSEAQVVESYELLRSNGLIETELK